MPSVPSSCTGCKGALKRPKYLKNRADRSNMGLVYIKVTCLNENEDPGPMVGKGVKGQSAQRIVPDRILEET